MHTKYKFNPENKLVVLTGAGISAESGLKTFRDNNGLWENHNVEEVATPQGFRQNPKMVWRFYKDRYNQLKNVKPNPGHYALVDLENYLQDNFTLITQNVDGLHLVAGNKNVLEMHGSLRKSLCSKCNTYYDMESIDLDVPIPRCERCGGNLRPDVVWFGEIPYFLDEIELKLRSADFFMVVGTSGVVYPAAQFLQLAKIFGTNTIGINLAAPENVRLLDEFHRGKAGEILPQLVKLWTN
ncbi:MAG: NAD-dependent deacetylase [Candidatus Cloacimonadota bacterium]|nr:NAD-dependent deacetylase [Candidatus Cloacimonadota bacterium]